MLKNWLIWGSCTKLINGETELRHIHLRARGEWDETDRTRQTGGMVCGTKRSLLDSTQLPLLNAVNNSSHSSPSNTTCKFWLLVRKAGGGNYFCWKIRYSQEILTNREIIRNIPCLKCWEASHWGTCFWYTTKMLRVVYSFHSNEQDLVSPYNITPESH